MQYHLKHRLCKYRQCDSRTKNIIFFSGLPVNPKRKPYKQQQQGKHDHSAKDSRLFTDYHEQVIGRISAFNFHKFRMSKTCLLYTSRCV